MVQEGTYVLHYTSADLPDGSTWSVYREQYVTADADEPIDGSQVHVSTHPTEADANAEANRLAAATATTMVRCPTAGCGGKVQATQKVYWNVYPDGSLIPVAPGAEPHGGTFDWSVYCEDDHVLLEHFDGTPRALEEWMREHLSA